MPTASDLPALKEYLDVKTDTTGSRNSFTKLVSSFMDSAKQQARISVNMADVEANDCHKFLIAFNRRPMNYLAIQQNIK